MSRSDRRCEQVGQEALARQRNWEETASGVGMSEALMAGVVCRCQAS